MLGDYKKIFYALQTPFGRKKVVDRWNEQSIGRARKDKNKGLTILLHGVGANYYMTVFGILKWFRKKGINIVSVGYDDGAPPWVSGKYIKRQINEILRKAKRRKINVIGVSLGGVIARYYAEELGGKKHIHKLVTIYTPIKPVKGRPLGVALNKAVGGDPYTTNIALKNMKNKFSVKNHLAIYGVNDWIIGNQYPIPKKFGKHVKQISVPYGHLMVSFNPEIMKIAVDYLKESNIKKTADYDEK